MILFPFSRYGDKRLTADELITGGRCLGQQRETPGSEDVAGDEALDSFCARIGEDLRSLRKSRGLTQSGAAEAVGVSRYTLTRIESGDMGVALGTIVALAQLYQAPTSFLALMNHHQGASSEVHSPG